MQLQSTKASARRLAEIVLLGVLGALAVAAESGRSNSPADWRLAGSLSNRGEMPRVLAWAPDANRIAFADDAGVSRLDSGRQGGGPARTALEGVRDLAFDRDDVLWIGADSGLYRWEDGQRLKRRALRGGENANRVTRIVAGHSGILVGTEAGAFWSTSGSMFQALDVGSAAVAIRLVAIESQALRRAAAANAHTRAGKSGGGAPVPHRLWTFGAGQLMEVEGYVVDAGMRIVSTRSLPLPRPMSDGGPVDLVVDPSGEFLHLVFGDVVASRSLAHAANGSASRRWTMTRPVLPPGSRMRRLAWTSAQGVLVATDHGLLEGGGLGEPLRRSSHPVGSADCVDVRSDKASNLAALCRRGVYLSGASGGFDGARTLMGAALAAKAANGHRRRDERSASDRTPVEDGPPLVEIRARALRRAGIDVARSRNLREGLRRRAYFPELSLRLGVDFDRERQTDADQAFISGERRHLLDRSHDRQLGLGASIEFDWDLGGIAFPEDAVDLSRELRQVVSLRDDISDEINQLYFERQAIRKRLASDASIESGERTRMRWRASEIDAGLDAWTGGWLTQWRERRRASRPSPYEDSTDAQSILPQQDPIKRPGPEHPVERSSEWVHGND